MANISDSTTASSLATAELEVLVTLIGRLAVASSEATRLAAEVQYFLLSGPSLAKLPATLALHTAGATTWVRAPPKTPADLEREFPDGSGEVWYVVIRGWEPGMYRTAGEATALTNGVPHQFHRKKTSRREALLFYRDNYLHATKAAAAAGPNNSTPAPAGTELGIQKWVAVTPDTVV
ncbi:hypothetical protein FB451DRAFT_1195496 [Mycena latifolia]|nr:hypothetical protein FB451DRAFT_1195496 [Mycena latifolia]